MSANEDLLSTLTDEERAAIADTSDDELNALQRVASGADDDDDGTADDDAPAGSDETAAVDGGEPAAAADVEKPEERPAEAAAAAATAPAASAPAAAPQPQVTQAAQASYYEFALPADFDAKVQANKEASAALFERLKSGEITAEELQAEQEQVLEDRRKLDSMRTQAEIAQNSREQAMRSQHRMAVDSLFAQAKETIDYSADEAKRGDLDAFVRALAANPAHNDKPLSWFLEEGHRRVCALHGLGGKPKADPEVAKREAAEKRKQPLADAPKTLAGVPGGQAASDVGGEFDDIMALDGEAFEAAIGALAKSNPARYAKFIAGGQ